MDYLFKFMMLIVVIPLIFLMFIFAMKHTNHKILGFEQEFSGNKEESVLFIQKLCDVCLSKANFNRDCFMLHLKLKEQEGSVHEISITNDDFGLAKNKIIIQDNKTITSGDVKIKSLNNKCVLVVIE